MTTDINDRIATAKGWAESRKPLFVHDPSLSHPWTFWCNPEGKPARRPNFTGTLEGVAGIMRELNNSEIAREDDCNFIWGFDQHKKCYYVERRGSYGDYFATWESPEDHPGDCVGESGLSVFGREVADASTE